MSEFRKNMLGWEWIQSIWVFLSLIFEEAGPDFERLGLGVKQVVVLAILEKQDTPGALRSALGAPASTITSILNELEKKRLIRREIHPADRRQFQIVRTAEGDESLHKGIALIEELLAKKQLTGEELAAFRTVMGVLTRWTGG